MWMRFGVIVMGIFSVIALIWVTLTVAVSFNLGGAVESVKADSRPGGGEAGLPQAKDNEWADKTFTLKTEFANGRMAYVGVGGDIDGLVNPNLVARSGEIVRVIVVNGDGMMHNLVVPDLDTATPLLMTIGDSAELLLTETEGFKGTYPYFCSVSGHRLAGMEGLIIIR